MKKSSACGNSNSCVWVGLGTGDRVEVSADPTGTDVKVFTRAEWAAFVAGVKAGEFDLDRLTWSPRCTG